MTQVSLTNAAKTLESLITRAEAGEEIVITRRGKPCGKLVPIKTDPVQVEQLPRKRNKFGDLKRKA